MPRPGLERVALAAASAGEAALDGAARAPRRRPPLAASGQVLLSLAASVVLWHLAALALGNPLLFPTPLATLAGLVQMAVDGTIAGNLGITLLRMAMGFGLGVALGAPAGLLMGYALPVRWLLEPYVNSFRFVTPIALLSVIITWFGTGEESKVVLIAYVTTFMVLLNTMSGVLRIPTVTVRAAQSLGAGRLQLLVHVVAPAAVGSLLVGMRIALGYAFMTVVAAEIIASDAGVGYVLWTSQLYARTPQLFAMLVVVGILGLLVDRLFVRLTARTARRFGGAL